MAYTNGSSIKKVLIDGVLHPINDYRIEGTNFAVTQIAGDIAVGTPLTTEQLEHITGPVMSADGCVINAPALGTILIPKNVVFNPAATDDYVISYVSSPLEGKTYNLKITMDHTTGLPKEAVFAEEEVAAPPTNILKTKLDTYKTEFAKPVAERDPAIVAEAKVFGNDVLSKKPNIIVELDADNQPVEVFHATESPDPTAYYRYVNGKNECIDIYYDGSTDPHTTTDLAFPDLENIYVEKAKEYMEIHTTANTVVYKNTKPVMINEDTLGFTQTEEATQGQGVDGIIHYPKSVLLTSPNEFKISFKSGGMPSYQTTAKIEMSNDGLNWFANDETNGVASALNNELGVHSIFIRSNDYINSTSSYSSGMFYSIKTLEGNDITVKGILDALWGGKPIPTGACYCLFNINHSIMDTSDLIMPNTTAEACYKQMFYDCRNLVAAPVLPAKTVKAEAYAMMFDNCQSLVNAPTMNAETILNNALGSMFSQCSSLNNPPNLSFISSVPTLGMSTMFNGCTSLVEPPELPATTLGTSCYELMFSGCTSLTKAPKLPATTLADNCYNRMFQNCTSLEKCPELPATVLVPGCYREMFDGCTSLTRPVVLPHFTNMETLGLQAMFWKCSNIKWGVNGTPYKIEYGDGTDITTEIDAMFAYNGGSLPGGTGFPKTNTVYYLAAQPKVLQFTWNDVLKGVYKYDPDIAMYMFNGDSAYESSNAGRCKIVKDDLASAFPFCTNTWLDNIIAAGGTEDIIVGDIVTNDGTSFHVSVAFDIIASDDEGVQIVQFVSEDDVCAIVFAHSPTPGEGIIMNIFIED